MKTLARYVTDQSGGRRATRPWRYSDGSYVGVHRSVPQLERNLAKHQHRFETLAELADAASTGEWYVRFEGANGGGSSLIAPSSFEVREAQSPAELELGDRPAQGS